VRPNPICPNFAPALVALAILCGASCGTDPRQSVPGPTDPVDQAVTRLRECLPPSTTSDVSLPQLAVSSIVRLPNQTRVEVVAWAENGPAMLRLPLYVRSRGRWILGENDRVYIVDQDCRTYALNDVEFRLPRTSPGVIPIRANQAVRGALLFPPLGPRARLGALVYGRRYLPTIFFPSPETSNAGGGDRRS